tara:strand:- start:281 stop:532 length:252 start_codon:yes stop_codon:yes gene_type:complete
MEKLKAIVDEAMGKLEDSLSKDQSDKLAAVIEVAVIRGMLEGQHRAVDVCNDCGDAEKDTAQKIAAEIRQKNDLLITNLSSLR